MVYHSISVQQIAAIIVIIAWAKPRGTLEIRGAEMGDILASITIQRLLSCRTLSTEGPQTAWIIYKLLFIEMVVS